MEVLASYELEDRLVEALADPHEFVVAHQASFFASLESEGVNCDAVRAYARTAAFLHLPAIFDPAGLPDTPTAWSPVPSTQATLLLQIAVILVASLLGMESVSYGSENAGQLFVNLVTLPGQGAMAEKSQASMNGHTDAATFPFRGTTDPTDARIAPSPDVVFLGALRNPDEVPTVVMPLAGMLTELTERQVEVLKGDRLVLLAQRSFEKGTERILGESHSLDGTNVLFDSAEGTWVRYTHSQSHVFDDGDDEAIEAKATWEGACKKCALQVVLKPGDLLAVNNRKALHGRGRVGSVIGGQSRWLVRSYGLDTTGLESNRRYTDSPHVLFP
ncbi:hypothetical protein [Roseateles chitinivorans]|uniref:hypothetical protein n=1 Tax=Roseateles chitinivorans TaxID=2917965 RepID=UPI003D67F539